MPSLVNSVLTLLEDCPFWYSKSTRTHARAHALAHAPVNEPQLLTQLELIRTLDSSRS